MTDEKADDGMRDALRGVAFVRQCRGGRCDGGITAVSSRLALAMLMPDLATATS